MAKEAKEMASVVVETAMVKTLWVAVGNGLEIVVVQRATGAVGWEEELVAKEVKEMASVVVETGMVETLWVAVGVMGEGREMVVVQMRTGSVG